MAEIHSTRPRYALRLDMPEAESLIGIPDDLAEE